MEQLELRYPELTSAEREELARVRALLEEEQAKSGKSGKEK